MFVAVAAMSFASCGNKTATAEAVDSTAEVIDSIVEEVVDSIEAEGDSIIAEVTEEVVAE